MPLILTAACTGNKWMRKDNPNIPYTTQEIIDDGIAAIDAGASMMHVHVRTDDGTPTLKPEPFVPVIEAYKKHSPDIIIQMSVGGMQGRTFELLEPLLQLRPDLASFNLTEPDHDTIYMAEKFAQYGVKPVIECFSLDMLRGSHALLAEGRIKSPLFIEMLFPLKDEEGTNFATLSGQLLEFCRWLPKGAVWSTTRGGSGHVRLQALGAALGGHLRTGLEDCISYKKGEYVKSSAELVAQAASIAKLMGRKIATPQEARTILGI